MGTPDGQRPAMMPGRAGGTLLPVRAWEPGCASLAVASVVYIAEPGSPTRLLPCIYCERELLDSTFRLITLTSPFPCERTGSHLPSATVAAHVGCLTNDDERLSEMIADATASCFTG